MKSRKLMEALGDLLDRKKSKKRKHLDELKTLLAKLEKKKVELQEQIPRDKNKHKLERLSKELEVIKVQQAKGLKPCGSSTRSDSGGLLSRHAPLAQKVQSNACIAAKKLNMRNRFCATCGLARMSPIGEFGLRRDRFVCRETWT